MINEIELARINNLKNLRLPRWNELPEFEIYNDQLISIVEGACKDLYEEGEKIITPSMINNYVKWNVLTKPIKKKYEKRHLACCIVITCLKTLISINNIKIGIEVQTKHLGIESAYNSFCDKLEEGMDLIFGNYLQTIDKEVLLGFKGFKEERVEKITKTIEEEEHGLLIISLITEALCSKILTEIILNCRKREMNSEGGKEFE